MIRAYLFGILAALAFATPSLACVTGFDRASHTISMGSVRVDAFGLITREDRGSTDLRLVQSSLEPSPETICATVLRVTPLVGLDLAMVNGEGEKLPLSLLLDSYPGQASANVASAMEFSLSGGVSTMDAEVFAGGTTTSGTFSGTFRLELLANGVPTAMDESELLILATVPPAVSIRFDDPRGSGHKTLDFGRMTSNAMRLTDLHVSATTAYTLSVMSEGGGTMTNREAGPRATVPYELQINGQRFPIASLPAEMPTQQARSGGLSSEAIDIGIVIGDVAGYAGKYSDVLTFTVTSVE